MNRMLLLIILLVNFYAAAQVGTAPAPLKPGNRWTYNEYLAGDYAHPYLLQFEITDSIEVINGTPFYLTRGGGYYGITSNKFFSRYDETISDSLYTYFEVNPQKGDTWEQHWKNGIILYNALVDTFTAKVFSKYTLIYVVDRSDSSKIISSREYWTKEYGMLDGLYEQEEDILKGCVIDGVLYGDTTITGIEEVRVLPDKFVLYQNYPNPFNPSTLISWQMAKGDKVKLVVYDILGREIKTLANKYYNTGKYSISFNAGDLPSGIYFYRIITNDFIQTKKMILVR